MKRLYFFVTLLVILVAPAAFGCAQCYMDYGGCWYCAETWSDGAQKCLINDFVGCQPQYACAGPAGPDYCGGSPCPPYPIIAQARPPKNGWEVASVRFVPVRQKGRGRV